MRYIDVRRTLFPDLWELYYRRRTKIIGDEREGRMLELWLGEYVEDSGTVAANRLSGMRDL